MLSAVPPGLCFLPMACPVSPSSPDLLLLLSPSIPPPFPCPPAQNPNGDPPRVQDQPHQILLYEEGQIHAGDHQRETGRHHRGLPSP